MTFVAPESAPLNAARIPSIIVLGADALLAALPATPVQLAHACALAGYQSVVPASWGDELIAVASLRALGQHGPLPAIQCSCPHVAHRLLAVGTDLRPYLLSLVAPPVVLARYLRAAHAPGKLRITYVGRCPGAADEVIDARLTPDELLAMLADRQILLDEQPRVYDSVIPPDRRRYRSQPGGLPTPDMLWSASEGGASRSLVELYGDDLPVELAQHLLAGRPVLIDCAPKLGCVCSGAATGVDPADARTRVVALEPPRATGPVVDEQLVIETALALPASPRSAIDVVAPSGGPGGGHGDDVPAADSRERVIHHEEVGTHSPTASTADSGHASSPAMPRRYSPSRGIARAGAGTLPTARDAGGRQLPRTYVAHRRSPPRAPRGSAPSSGVGAESPGVDATTANRGATGSLDPVGEPMSSTRETSSFATGPLTAGGAPALAASPMRADAATTRPPQPNEPAAARESTLYAERPVPLPLTPRSDAPPRPEPAPHASNERPLMQLLTLGLLISMIVLVSAAVGVLVGRWMTQR